MKQKLYKILSIVLCLSLMPQIITFATPIHSTFLEENSDWYEIDNQLHKSEDGVSQNQYQEEMTEIDGAIPNIALLSETEMTFLDYFPDISFAEGIARYLKKDVIDTVSTAELSGISNLSLKDNYILSIEGIGMLTGLKEADFMNNYISEIPDEIGKLTKLTRLTMGYNQLNKISGQIGKLTKLEYLYLWENQLTQLPNEIGNLTELSSLVLGNNRLTELPAEISNLKKVRTFVLTNNSLTQLPGEIGNMNQIVGLYLQNNQLTEIPAEICNLPILTTLSLEGNMLTSALPESVFEVENLILGRQEVIENGSIRIMPNDEISYESLVTPLILQLQERNEGILPGYWVIRMPNKSTEVIDALDGSEITSSLFTQSGMYNISYTINQDNAFGENFSFYDVLTSVIIEDSGLNTHKVTVVTRYLDDALPEQSNIYKIEHGAHFEKPFEVLEGYDLFNMRLRVMPEFNVDMDIKTVSLDVVDRDYTIELEFDRAEYKVKLTTMYLDDYLPQTTQTNWIQHADGYTQTYKIAEGYQIANLDQLPSGVIVDEENMTVTISNVAVNYDIILKFEKIQCDVVIRIIYDDGSKEDQLSTYTVPYGNSFETKFEIEQGYAINKINFNAIGVLVNKSRQTIAIDQIISPVEVKITVR